MHAAAAQPRLANFHRPKKQLLGRPGHVPPAWKPSNNPHAAHSNAAGRPGASSLDMAGSKILISNLPMDVGESEELFKKTVGPLKESFLVYNSQGRSKGMAVVTFSRPGDAAVAHSKYNGKIVDGRKAIRIEIVYPTVKTGAAPATVAPTGSSLISRIGGIANDLASRTKPVQQQQRPVNGAAPSRPLPASVLPSLVVNPIPVGRARTRVKKGAKRVKKRPQPATKDELDKEMDDYRTSSIPSDEKL